MKPLCECWRECVCLGECARVQWCTVAWQTAVNTLLKRRGLTSRLWKHLLSSISGAGVERAASVLPTTDSTSTTEHPRAATEPHADPGLYLARDPNPDYTARGAPGAAPAAAAGTSAWSAWSKVSASPFFWPSRCFCFARNSPTNTYTLGYLRTPGSWIDTS